MRFRCDREELLSAVQAVSGVVAGKGVHPVYESVEVVASNDSLTLVATDLEIGMKIRVGPSDKLVLNPPDSLNDGDPVVISQK